MKIMQAIKARRGEMTLEQIVIAVLALVLLVVLIFATFYFLKQSQAGGDILFGIFE